MRVKVSVFIILVLYSFICLAQKLPNVQNAGLRVPAGIKIDGKSTEWSNQFQAYNKAVELTYAVANDDENLYLIVQATKPRIIEKIISVGLTFIVNTDGKNKADAKENITISYPALGVEPGQKMLWYAGAKARSDVKLTAANAEHLDDIEYSTNHVDSLVAIANNLLETNAKTIKVTGISEITDPSISIYNSERIRVAATFNIDGIYTYELAIPLKYLGLTINKTKQFSYSIRLESRLTNPKRGLRTRYIYPNGVLTDVDQDLDSTTDFWGMYTLAKN